jgi:hypothetical protein
MPTWLSGWDRQVPAFLTRSLSRRAGGFVEGEPDPHTAHLTVGQAIPDAIYPLALLATFRPQPIESGLPPGRLRGVAVRSPSARRFLDAAPEGGAQPTALAETCAFRYNSVGPTRARASKGGPPSDSPEGFFARGSILLPIDHTIHTKMRG